MASGILLSTQKKAYLHLPQNSQEDCVPRGVSKVYPYFQGAEYIFGLGFTQTHGFARVLCDQPKNPCLDHNWDSAFLQKEQIKFVATICRGEAGIDIGISFLRIAGNLRPITVNCGEIATTLRVRGVLPGFRTPEGSMACTNEKKGAIKQLPDSALPQ